MDTPKALMVNPESFCGRFDVYFHFDSPCSDWLKLLCIELKCLSWVAFGLAHMMSLLGFSMLSQLLCTDWNWVLQNSGLEPFKQGKLAHNEETSLKDCWNCPMVKRWNKGFEHACRGKVLWHADKRGKSTQYTICFLRCRLQVVHMQAWPAQPWKVGSYL